ncbi:MAG: response regulator [Synechococcaceae cyanobacterium MAG-AL1]|nr:response regulator [Candidatus Regnicoccus frigidus MAG-AL1]
MRPDLLLVQQEDRRRNQTIQFLEEGGWNVLHTDNMLNAHPMALSFKPSVIIISDTNPDRKGLKACQDIRADCRTETIPILILSDLSGVADKLQGFRAGADDYIAIPCDFEELFVRTKALLLNRHLINTMPSTTPWEGQLLDV